MILSRNVILRHVSPGEILDDRSRENKISSAVKNVFKKLI